MKKIYKVLIIIPITCLLLILLIYLYNIKEQTEIILQGKEEVVISVFSTYKEEGFTIKSNRKNKKYDVVVTNNVDTKHIGTYEIEYSLKNNNTKKIRKVKVIDDTAPVITLKGSKVVYLCPSSTYKEEGFTVNDNYDTLSEKDVKIETLKDYIKYTVYDSSNNKGYITRSIINKDIESPKLEIEDATVYLNEKYYDTYKVTDNCDKDISKKVKVTGNVDTSKTGTYTLTYTVTDASFNVTTKEKQVKVIERPKKDYKVIYLTFDDGPSIDITPKILDLLKKYNIKATFFVIGHDNSINYLIKRIFDEGHTIGTHTYSHSYKKVYESDEAFLKEVEKINNKVEMITGTKTNIIRFPGGSSNTVSKNYSKDIMTRLTKKVQELGYRYFDWNVGSNDTSTQDSNKICKNVIKGLNKGTNIVLMHDFAGHEGTYEALPCIIEYATKNGYTFSKITKDTKEIHHKVAN